MILLYHGQSVFICVNPWLKIFRAGGIRTHDLLNPIQAFYQAELRPDLKLRICANSGDWPQLNTDFHRQGNFSAFHPCKSVALNLPTAQKRIDQFR
jgi:hypothetical protein